MNFFPPKEQFSRSTFSNIIQTDLKISKSNKIISIGSCFAREIKNALIDKGYNYLSGETDKDCWVNKELFKGDNGRHKTEHSSIAWERVYHTHTFNQIVKYSFGKEYDRLKEFKSNGESYVTDILRSRVVYKNMDIAKADLSDHIKQSKKMFMDAEYLIFTMGFTEIWKSKSLVLGALHKDVDIDKKFSITDVDDNYNQMLEAWKILKNYNPKLKLIISVSPIHIRATHREGLDAITASCAAKSILRSVCDKICVLEDVYYFPSYEIATICSPMIGLEVYSDGHHISSDVMDFVMGAFENKCLIK